ATTLIYPDSVLVGQSLGAIAIVRLLSFLRKSKIAGTLLVAPAEPSMSTRTASFGPIPQLPLQDNVVFASIRNDLWMDQQQARSLADSWKADFIDMGDAGHINIATGYGPWAQGKALREQHWPQKGSARPRVFLPVERAPKAVEIR